MSLFSTLIPSRNLRSARADGAVDDERFVVPAYELKPAADAFHLELFVPGVTKDAVEIQIDQGELVVTARRRWQAPESWTEVFRETADANYRLRVDLAESVNVEQINAELENGVLRVKLPKAESVKPRKIDVT